ncbi:MAG: lysine--tRNA ligase [Pseudomonadota bacterium]
MNDISIKAIESKAWPFQEAQKILDHIGNKTPKKGYVLFESGYGPSGLPHIGTFGEVARTTMIRAAFQKISDIPTRLFCFSDDMDGLRKIPDNLPNSAMLKEHLHKPLTAIPDPFGEAESFGHYMNAKLRSFLDRFSFEYEFCSATEYYKSGKFDKALLGVLEKYDEVMALMLPTLGDERRSTYSPFLPLCPRTGRVLQVPITEVKLDSGSVVYQDDEGKFVEVPVTGGACKLQWKPDFAMRWACLDVDFEMYGKDHRPNAELYTNICRTLGGTAPVQFFYEHFLGEDGAKISKSKGNGITVEEWLKYAPLESMSLFMYQTPTRAKRLFFDVIPKNVDDYINLNSKYHEETDEVAKLANPVYHIHNGNVPKLEMLGLSFALLLNLVSVCNAEDKRVLWGFISKYAPTATPETAPYLDHLAGYALCYYHDFIKTKKEFLLADNRHKELLNQILVMLGTMPEGSTGEDIQKGIYSVGREAGYENLRDFFKEMYQILLGQTDGPRLGSFIALFGIENTKSLILEKIA